MLEAPLVRTITTVGYDQRENSILHITLEALVRFLLFVYLLEALFSIWKYWQYF